VVIGKNYVGQLVILAFSYIVQVQYIQQIIVVDYKNNVFFI